MGVKWFAAGNDATGFIAVGNIATGVIAFGNVARGIVAVGNLAVGVVAIGNVGFGVVAGGGATVGVGMLAVSGVIAIPVIDGLAGFQSLAAVSPLFGGVPLLLWGLLSVLMPGRRPMSPEKVDLVDPARLASGEITEGWVTGRLRAVGAGGEVPVRLVAGRVTLFVAVAPEATGAMQTLVGKKILARVTTEDRLVAVPTGYREAPPTARMLVATTLSAAAVPPVPWADQSYIQWYISRAWRVGAIVGTAIWLGLLLT